MPKKILLEVAKYCWSKNFINIFVDYFQRHGHLFEDAPEVLAEGEHNLQYYSLFQDYLVLYENTLTDYLSTLEVPISDFYDEVRESKDVTDDPYLKLFIECLLASTDYSSFYKVMAKEGKKYKQNRMITNKQSTSRDLNDISISIADAKDIPREVSSSKDVARNTDDCGAKSDSKADYK